MTTLAQPPFDLQSSHSFHVHSSEIANQDDMEQAEGTTADSDNTITTRHSHIQTQAPADPSPHPHIHTRTSHVPPDFDMDSGDNTTGISPQPPWDVVGFVPTQNPHSATPHDHTVTASTADASQMDSTYPATLQDDMQDSTVLMAPPDFGVPSIRDDLSMSPPRQAGAFHSASQPTDHDAGDGDDSAEDEEDDEDGGHAMQFYPFQEDLSVPTGEEVRIINSSTEYSALDNQHWQAQTFFDTRDAEVIPRESGMIEWTLENFNGTKENPRKELLVRSPIVRIGNHDWRIKLLPRGHLSTDRVSVYIECLSIQADAHQVWPEEQLCLPTIGETKLPKRQAVAAQISVLIYNPEEPRVHEFRRDAHQFHSESPDHGWSRFTTVPWYEIHRRSYTSRQPLLRNDKLAIKAFIRIIYDPTGCLWANNEKAQDSVPMTGLQHLPSFDDLALGPVVALWLHLRPFRRILYQLGALDLPPLCSPTAASDIPEDRPNALRMLQAVLYRMRIRAQELPHSAIHDYVNYIFETDRDSYDVMQTMDNLHCEINNQLRELHAREHGRPVGAAAFSAYRELQSVFGPANLPFSGARKTKLSIVDKPTMQDVVNGANEQLKCLKSPQLLTIELDRQVFDREKRCWKKLMHKVRLDDEIDVGGTMYTLYGFVAHAGYLKSGRYSSFFRPNGLGNLWYTYKSSRPECLTMAKAVAPREGSTSSQSFEEPFSMHDRSSHYNSLGHALELESVAYVVLYVREDVASDTFYFSCPESWDVPQWITDDYKPTPSPAEPLSPNRVDGPSVSVTGAADSLSYDEGDAPKSTVSGGQDDDTEMSDAANPESTAVHRVFNYFSQPYYDGYLKDDAYHGEGHFINLNGDEYTGTFSHGNYEGYGKMKYQNGDTYEGLWNDGKHDGQGVYTEKRTGNVYKGNFQEGKKYGEGTTLWKVSEEQSRMCQICFEKDVNAAFYDCGHVVACAECARRVEICPVCRRRIRDVLRIYYTA